MHFGSDRSHSLKLYIVTFVKWLCLASCTGLVCGAVGVAFHAAIEIVTALRAEFSWLLYGLPLFGVLIVVLYKKTGMIENRGTNGIFEAVRSGERVPLRLAPLIFAGTVLTHLGGGSSGREGAALQMGGSIGAGIARAAKLDQHELRIVMMCGMSAVFSALFGTPLTATLFCLEVIDVGIFQFSALLPCMCSALIAYRIALAAGLSPASYLLPGAPGAFSLTALVPILVLGGVCGGVSILLCETMHGASRLYKKYIPSPLWRAAAGGALLVLLTLLVGNGDYNGAGMTLAERALNDSKIFAGAFLLKLLFTAVTLGAGFRGGEIVPTLCIGATLGSVVGPLLGIDPGFAAAIGMIAVFCGAVNCPVSSIILSVEFFGSTSLLYFAAACAVSYLLSGRYGLYAAQKLVYSKLKPTAHGE